MARAESVVVDRALGQVHWPRPKEQGSRRAARRVRSTSYSFIGSSPGGLYARYEDYGDSLRASRLTLDLRGLFGHRRSSTVAPTQPFLARAKTGEIAPAGRAPIRSGAAAQHDHRPAWRMVILFAPGGQFLAVTTGTARVFPGSGRPDAGSPAASAAPAAQWVNPEERADFLAKILLVRYPDIACSTLRTRKLHESQTTEMTT